MSTSNQQTLADSGANERPPMLERENYIPWEIRFIRFLDNKLEDRERIRLSCFAGAFGAMESNNNLNKREGLAGTFDYGDLATCMQRFNENAVILGSTQPRQAIRVLRNPNYESSNLDKPGNSTITEAMESAFIDGDHIGVSACAGRIGPKLVDKVYDGVDISIPYKVVDEFDSRTGLEAVMEGGPWMIRDSQIIIKEWSRNTSLMKEELTHSWGHSSFARCLIEVSSDEILKESITIGIPLEEGMVFSKENITVKYEWQPPRCEMCKVFGHNVYLCPKKVGLKVVEQNDGFQQVINKKQNNKSGSSSNNNNIFGNGGKGGFQAGKSKFAYVPKAADLGFKSGASNGGNLKTTSRTMKHTKREYKGFESVPYTKEVRQVVNKNNLSVCAILESHVDVSAVYDTCKKFCYLWKWTSNGSIYDKGSRIILGWNDDIVDVMIMSQTNQVMHVQGNLPDRVDSLRKEFDEAQKAIDKEPTSSILREEHAHYLLAFKAATLDEERFLRQKSKVEWLNAGDFNTAYFHRIVKNKCARNQIKMVRDSSNVFYEGNVVVGAFVTHYENFLDIEGSTTPLANQYLFSHVLNSQKTVFMVRDVMDNEIKEALFSIGDDKAPALMVSLLLSLRKLGMLWVMMLQVLFMTSLLMIIANRIKGDLGDLKEGSAFKVDIQKANDTVDWAFLKSILIGFGFHHKMVDWIMVCVSTTSYSVCVNGDLHGWFRGKRGLRQGDPLSPYLFTLVMEVLTLILHQKVYNSKVCQYHHLFKKQRIINLCFADDLFLFTRGRPSFVDIIMLTLEEFKNVSGSVLSIPKSTSLFCNVLNALKATILNYIPFTEGSLHVKYLGVPLISSRLLYRDCKVLVENLESWIFDWRNKLLSLAGRLQLVRSILSSMHIYWAFVFILPPRIIHELEQLMRSFLWCQGEMRGWHVLCPIQGMLTVRDIVRSGFGLSDLCEFNRSLDDACIWSDTDKQELETQDRLQQWDVGPNTDLNLLRFPLCDLFPDSHSHLFFECHFSIQVWFQIRGLSGMDMIPPRFANIITFPILISKGRSIVSIIARILLAAMTYYIWIERNSRLFKKKASTILHNVQVITFMVRLKLVSFKFKKVSTRSRLLLDQWKVPSFCMVQEGSTRSGNDTDADDADIRPIYDEELMTEIQEKVFAIAALKNDLRKLKGNSVDTKPQMSKPRFASQVDVNNNLSRPVTQHYLPKRRESVFAKPDHMIASSESRFQSTADGSKPKPRSNNQTPRSLPVSKSSCVTITAVPKADHSKRSSSFSDSKQFVCYKCHKCVFNANHDACITKLLQKINSCAKILSHKIKNHNKPINQKSHTKKPGRQIFTGYMFSPNKTSAVYKKTSPRSDLRWKPMGRIFKFVGLRWIPTRKLFDSCTSKVDSEPPHGSNVDIPNIHECKQTLDVSVELESLFGPLFDEYFNGENQVVSKSSAVTTADASDKRQQQPDSTSSTSTLATTVTADGNFDL
ncbi:hypothetical protein Tco_0189981 [Tanacetum coccineum]